MSDYAVDPIGDVERKLPLGPILRNFNTRIKAIEDALALPTTPIALPKEHDELGEI